MGFLLGWYANNLSLFLDEKRSGKKWQVPTEYSLKLQLHIDNSNSILLRDKFRILRTNNFNRWIKDLFTIYSDSQIQELDREKNVNFEKAKGATSKVTSEALPSRCLEKGVSSLEY